MRLHTLELTAIGPFPGTESVDFDRVGASGLFLLEGPTGAGKTTVLDAVTFALYGGLSGSGASAERLRSGFADPAVAPQVRLELSVAGVRYRLTRRPAHDRPKKRGTGTTPQAASALLERREPDGSWLVLASSVADAGTQVGEIVGLSRDQFTQVVLLPQGEFARFLRAGDDERREVLRRLFAVDVYASVTDRLEVLAQQARRARHEADEAIGRAVAAAAEAAGRSPAESAEAVTLGRVEQAALLSTWGAQLHVDLDAAAAVLADAESSAAAAGAAAAAAADLVERLERVAAAHAELADLLDDEAAQRDRRERLGAARRAAPLAPLLDAVARSAGRLARERDTLELLLPDLDPAAREESDEAALRADADRRRGQAGALDHLVAMEHALPETAARAAALRAEAARLDEAWSASVALAEALPQERGRLLAVRSDLTPVAGALPARESARKAASLRLGAVERLADAQARRDRLVAVHASALATWQELAAAHKRLVGARLTGIAAELAAGLRPGEPCAVCGALEHPRPAVATLDAVTADDVERADLEAGAALHARDDAAAALAEAEADRARLEAAADGLTDVEAARDDDARAQHDLDEALEAAGALDAVDRELAALITRAEETAAAVADARAAAATATEQAQAAETALADDEAALAAARGDAPDVASRRDLLLSAARRDDEVATALVSLREAAGTHDDDESRLVAALRGTGFADPAAARAALLDDATTEALEGEVRRYDDRLAEVRGLLADPVVAGLDPVSLPVAREAAAQARGSATHAGAARDEATRATERARTRHERFTARCADLDAAIASCAEIVTGTEEVIRLAALAKGTAGARRMPLVTFVLRHWFEQVVAEANHRLAAMSSGRYLLERTDATSRADARGGLGLQVVDTHTGTSRPAASLSGGETFYASLALALGLADVVRGQAGGADLDTLFIDEGFGTLDPDTLEQVMSVIDDLRERGRVVGIVSHVAELKDRVAERIEVRRTRPDGPSTLRVVA